MFAEGSARVADAAGEASVRPRRWLLTEDTLVILSLPPVTRHPVVVTPGVLEQPA